jgi:Secretion system C-terminal sorting domain
MSKSYNLIFFLLCSHTLFAQRMMYVNGFNAILNSNTSKTTLLQYAQNHSITHLALYDLHLVQNEHDLTNANSNQILANFIADAKQNYGITKIIATGENATFFQTRIMAYNNTRRVSTEKFDGLGMEFEFWTPSLMQTGGYYCTNYLIPNHLTCDSAGAFAFCKSQLKLMKTMTTNSTHPMTVEMYTGWPNQGQMQEIADIVDKTYIHVYVSNVNTMFAYALTRLQLYNTYAGVENISIIFSAESAFMGTWLVANGMAAAEQIFTTAYNNATGAWKNHLNWQGFSYFTYSMLSNVALPLERIDFKGFMNHQKSILIWQIENATKIRGFEVEKSTFGNHFEKIGFVPFTEAKNYDFSENDSNGGYYRLKILEMNGHFTYSNVLFIEKKDKNSFVVFPNPTVNRLFIQATSLVKDTPYAILNAVGQVILEDFILPESIDLQSFTTGIYWLKAGNHIQKFVII